MKYRKLNINTYGNEKLENIITHVFPRLSKLNALIDRATQAGEITVDFAPLVEATEEGKWLPAERLILIKKEGAAKEFFESFVMSLLQAARPAVQPQNFKNADAFAQAFIKEKYDQLRTARDLFDEIMLNPKIVALCNANGNEITPEDIEEYKQERVLPTLPEFVQYTKNTKVDEEQKYSAYDALCLQYNAVMAEKAKIEQEKKAQALKEKAMQEQAAKAKKEAAAAAAAERKKAALKPKQQAAPVKPAVQPIEIEPAVVFEQDGFEDILDMAAPPKPAHLAGRADRLAEVMAKFDEEAEVDTKASPKRALMKVEEEKRPLSKRETTLLDLQRTQRTLAEKKQTQQAALQAAKRKFKF